MAKTNEPSIDRPPRGGPATRGWKVQRTDGVTKIWTAPDAEGIQITRGLTDEELDLLRLAAAGGHTVNADTALGLLDDVVLRAALLDHYRDHAYKDWRKAVGLPVPD